jgi:mutual gliding-motility protein MglA
MRDTVVRTETDSHGHHLPSLDTRTRELICKVVFAGPVGSGVGTTFRELWALIPDAASTAVIPGPGDSPVYQLRFRPRPAIHIQGMKLAFNLWGYEAEPTGEGFVRTLDGVDAVVFVADSDPVARKRNQLALRQLHSALKESGARPGKTAMLLQYNKRDLKDAVAIPEMETQLNPSAWPFVATAASRSQGLQELLDRISTVVPAHLLGNTSEGHGQSPTDSMTSAFARAERKLFKRDADPLDLPKTVTHDEDRTVLGATGASPFAANPIPIPTSPADLPDMGAPHTPQEEVSSEGPAVAGIAVTGAESTLRTPEVIDAEVADLAGFTINRLGTPEMLNPRWLVVPFIATPPSRPGDEGGDGDPVEVELRIRLGRSAKLRAIKRKAARSSAPPAPVAAADAADGDEPVSPTPSVAVSPAPVQTARKAPAGPVIPLSWVIFAVVLFLVVVVAYLLGSILS